MLNRIPPMMQLTQRNNPSSQPQPPQQQQPSMPVAGGTTTQPSSNTTTTYTSILPSSISQQQQQHSVTSETISAIPTLRVMRLQKPALHVSSTTIATPTVALGSPPPTTAAALQQPPPLPSLLCCQMIEHNPTLLQSALCLPDSLTVYVGETFTAYLGVLNTPSTIATTSLSTASTTIPTLPPPLPPQYPTIRRLTVVAQLQTPSQRYPLPSRLDPQQQQYHQQQSDTTTTSSTTTMTTGAGGSGLDVPPFGGVDAIVSHTMEEAGPHILRVEVGYYSPPDVLQYQTFRKFYRFNVKIPLLITEKYTIRDTDTSCYTCLQIEYPASPDGEPATVATSAGKPQQQQQQQHDASLVLSNVHFVTPDGFIATNITEQQQQRSIKTATTTTTAVDIFDQLQTMRPGDTISYIYHIQTNTPAATLRGIARGDGLGHLSLQWYKAMGECGTLQKKQSSSSMVYCPAAGTTKYDPTMTSIHHQQNEQQQYRRRHQQQLLSATTTPSRGGPDPVSQFVMYRSGLSVDVAATAAATTTTTTPALSSSTDMDEAFQLITVEPVDPPLHMQLYVPVTVPLLVINHSRHPCTVQIQFNIPPPATSTNTIKNNNNNHTNDSNGIVISGTTYQNIGTIQSHGGSTVTNFTFLPIQMGVLSIQYCSIMDVTSAGGRTVIQPPLWTTYVTTNAATTATVTATTNAETPTSTTATETMSIRNT